MAWKRLIGTWISIVMVQFSMAQEISDSLVIVDRVVVTISPLSNTKLDQWDNESMKRTSINEVIEKVREDGYRHGFITSKITVEEEDSLMVISVNPCESYAWSDIIVDDETMGVLRKANINIKRLKRKPYSPRRVGNAFNKTLNYLENNGFPFAEIRLDSVDLLDNNLQAKLKIDKGPLVLFDSLNLLGDLKIRETCIANYTGIKEGSPYNEKAIRNAGLQLEQNQFVSVWRPLEVRFDNEKTEVTLFLNTKRASRFDGIVGFLPDDQTGDILITGDVALHLENSLHQGEIIDVNWRRLQSNTQDLDARAVMPFVLNSPISPDGRVKIYRRDTTFTDVFGQFGMRYIFGRNNFVRAFVDRQTTNLISTAQYENTVVIPEFLDRSIISYGLGLDLLKVDYLLNPSKGIDLAIDAAAGNKAIIENPALPQFIYDSLNLTSIQYRANLDAAYYVSVLPRLVWHQQFLGGSLLNDQLFNNEAYRIGGLKSIRGFNEESIFATTYGIARNELRYQIEKNGYFFALFDQGWYENTSLNRRGARRDTPYALGLGLTIGTKAGIFSISTAMGSQQGNPLLIRATKFHFGFLSVF